MLAALVFGNAMASEPDKHSKSTDMDNLELTQEWDKVFPESDKVDHAKVTFHNRYGITLAADLYKPKNASGRLAAVAVSGPYGAVKEPGVGPLCADACRTRFPDRGVRSLVLRREQRYAALPDIA